MNSNIINNQLGMWIIPPGRYSATFKQVSAPDPTQIRVVFELMPQRGLADVKKAGKYYYTSTPQWLEKDLECWLGRDRARELLKGCSGILVPLRKLIGTKAVLVISNEDRGQAVPLVKISEILPHTRESFEGSSTSMNNEGPKFRFSFTQDEDDSAMAA